MELLQQTINQIAPLDEEVMEIAKVRIDNLTKPLGSLGILEHIAVRLSGIYREIPAALGEKAVVVCAGDHGVVQEGVSAYPAEVTPQMVLNILNGGAAINVFSRVNGVRVVVVDVGVNAPPITHPNLINMRIANGTGNIARGAAMTVEQAVQAVETGIQLAKMQVRQGVKVLATGEMGIGNTTASSAVVAVFSGKPVAEVTGRGTGVNDTALENKRQIVSNCIKVNKPNSQNALDVLSKVGGFEIGALAGVIIGGASLGVPVVIDGFISGAAALLAYKMAPISREYMFASHLSQELGHRLVLDLLELKPLLHLEMRLGEGTGAVLTIPLLEASLRVIKEMATFDEAAVSSC